MNAKALDKTSTMDAQSLSNMAWSIAKLSLKQPRLLEAMSDAVMAKGWV